MVLWASVEGILNSNKRVKCCSVLNDANGAVLTCGHTHVLYAQDVSWTHVRANIIWNDNHITTEDIQYILDIDGWFVVKTSQPIITGRSTIARTYYKAFCSQHRSTYNVLHDADISIIQEVPIIETLAPFNTLYEQSIIDAAEEPPVLTFEEVSAPNSSAWGNIASVGRGIESIDPDTSSSRQRTAESIRNLQATLFAGGPRTPVTPTRIDASDFFAPPERVAQGRPITQQPVSSAMGPVSSNYTGIWSHHLKGGRL